MPPSKGPEQLRFDGSSVVQSTLKLLESGDFADATVVCGDRTWKVHRAVLASRSTWFKKALCGSFKEAQTGVINMREQDPSHIDYVLRHIYGEDIAASATKEKKPGVFCAHLFAVADFFDLEGLRTDSLRALVRYLDGILLICSSNSSTDEHATLLDLAELCEAVRATYDWTGYLDSPVQGSFVSLFWVIGTKLVEKGEISTLLGDCHPFTVDLMKTMAAGACHIENPWLLTSMDGRKKPCEKVRVPSEKVKKPYPKSSFTLSTTSVLPRRKKVSSRAATTLKVQCSRCDRKLDSVRDRLFYNSVDEKHKERQWCKTCALKMIEDNTFPWRPQNHA
ncbi:hypothetical protein N0V82_007044 [Gnomoniopsis sp. IMI 355080]|nr:hypothetical protein N0V82_007044 [Gnomoniopsis sp. IMI 355080]